jgi:3-oxoacyl-[acyl-carrier protein] reductase
MYASLENRTVIVTGGGRGFGRLMTLALAKAGANLVITGARSKTEVEETAREANHFGRGQVLGLVADVTDYRQCVRTVEETLALFGGVHALINNAARSPIVGNPNYVTARHKFWEESEDAYKLMVDTNLTGQFLMAKAAMPAMLAGGFGRIVNISTSLTTMVMQGLIAYGACKAALEAATVMWAKDLEGTGVTANVLLPGGAADTALIPGGTVGERAPKNFRAGKDMKAEGNEGFLLPPEIMVPPTLWLCADESNGVNGKRFIAKFWDPELPWDQAMKAALQESHPTPRIM